MSLSCQRKCCEGQRVLRTIPISMVEFPRYFDLYHSFAAVLPHQFVVTVQLLATRVALAASPVALGVELVPPLRLIVLLL